MTTQTAMNTTQIADLNSQAVTSLQDGMDQEAVVFLSEALSVLSSQLEEIDLQDYSPETGGTEVPIDNPSTNAAASNNNFRVISILSLPIKPIRDQGSSEWDAITFGDDCVDSSLVEGKIYNRAFVLPRQSDCLLSQHSHAETSAVLLFNTALTLHRGGLETGQSKVLLKALLLYKKALQVTENSLQQNYSSLAVVFLALTNNMAQIYVDLFDRDGLERSRFMLRSVFDWVGPTRMLDRSEYFFFNLNLMLLEKQNFLLAPCA
jgi:hypothetical protein